MDEQLKTQMAESAGKLLQWAEATSKDADAMLREQAPLVAQEIVAFQWSLSLVWVCVAVVFLVVSAVGWYVLFSRADKMEDGAVCVYGLLLTAASAVFVIAFCHNIGPLLEAQFAPRLAVLHELQKLL